MRVLLLTLFLLTACLSRATDLQQTPGVRNAWLMTNPTGAETVSRLATPLPRLLETNDWTEELFKLSNKQAFTAAYSWLTTEDFKAVRSALGVLWKKGELLLPKEEWEALTGTRLTLEQVVGQTLLETGVEPKQIKWDLDGEYVIVTYELNQRRKGLARGTQAVGHLLFVTPDQTAKTDKAVILDPWVMLGGVFEKGAGEAMSFPSQVTTMLEVRRQSDVVVRELKGRDL